MSAKLEATLKGINDLKGEIGAWEMRLEGVKGEIQALKGQRDALSKEIEDKKAAHNMEMDRSRESLRQQIAKISEEKELLKKQREEFNGILADFQKERNAFEREKSDALDIKANYTQLNDKVTEFLMIVKRAAERL